MRKVEDNEMRRWNEVGEMPMDIWNVLSSLHPNRQPRDPDDIGRYPAAATLKNGTYYSAVNFVERKTPCQRQHYSTSGFIRTKYPFDKETMIDLHDVISISASPNWTTDWIWRKMLHNVFKDWYICKLILEDGTKYWFFDTQSEFVNIPVGHTANEIVDVIPLSDIEKGAMGTNWLTEIEKRAMRPIRILTCFFDRPHSIRKKPRSF
jgi:hypothetical protein